MSQKLVLCLLFISTSFFSQNIKSIQLRPLQENNFSAIVPLGTPLEISFDDLDADSKDYQYKIEHMTHDWKSSRLSSSQFIDGFDQNTIINVSNSFNTLQNYTHYSVRIPNINTVITKSGNYLLSILNTDDDVIFTRRFVLYEPSTTVGVTVERSRNSKTLNTQQTIEFIINHPKIKINNPAQEVHVVILKNNNWEEKITNLQPTFFRPNQLSYTYTNKTNFWGGNEYLNFDNKLIRNNSLNVVKIIKKDIFHHYLYPFEFNPFRKYSYNPDINGQFVIRTLEAKDSKTEADYAMIHFTLSVEEAFSEREVYVYGAFNDFKIGSCRVLISSNVTARGIDVQQVSTVINFDIPKDVHTYLHRIGRSGRWGRKGVGINMITRRDISKMKEIEQYYSTQIIEMPGDFENHLK